MTRFARALGSKSCNKKVPEESTPWRELKKKVKHSNDEKPDSSSFEEPEKKNLKHIVSEKVCCDKSNAWSIVDNTPAKRKRKRFDSDSEEDNVTQSKKTSASVKATRWQMSDEDKAVLNKLREKLLSKGMPVEDVNGRIKDKIKQLKAKCKKKKCFKCQTSDHIFKDCPERKDNEVCFACGSTEHRLRDCRQKNKQGGKFAFATCFICKEEGHISSACPDNPTGLYPFGGGCHVCGEVTHFSKDCPKKRKETNKKQVTLDLLSDDVEGLPEDKPTNKVIKPSRSVKVVNF